MAVTIGKYAPVYNDSGLGTGLLGYVQLLGVSGSQFLMTYPYKQDSSASSSISIRVGTVDPETMTITFPGSEFPTTGSEFVYGVFHAGNRNRGFAKISADRYVVGHQAISTYNGAWGMTFKVVDGQTNPGTFTWYQSASLNNGIYADDPGEVCAFQNQNIFAVADQRWWVVSPAVRVSFYTASAANEIYFSTTEPTKLATTASTGTYPWNILTVRDYKVIQHSVGDTNGGYWLGASLDISGGASTSTWKVSNGPMKQIPQLTGLNANSVGKGFVTKDAQTIIVPYNNNLTGVNVAVIQAERSQSGVPTGGNDVTCSFTASLVSAKFIPGTLADSLWAVPLNYSRDSFAVVWLESDNQRVGCIWAQFNSGSVGQAAFTTSSAFLIKQADGFPFTDEMMYASRLDNDSIVVSGVGTRTALVWGVRFGQEASPRSASKCELIGADKTFGIDKIHWKQ